MPFGTGNENMVQTIESRTTSAMEGRSDASLGADESQLKHLLRFCFGLLLLLPCIRAGAPGGERIDPPRPVSPVPSERQLLWQDLEYYAFVHFNMNTFTDREWGDGTEMPALFDPVDLDCRQWARVCKEAGMRGIVLTAKHHDGFCLWPSAFTEHTVRNSPFRSGRGDVLRELSDACREFGLKFGVYLSPWDRHDPRYGDSPAYNEHFKNQLREVLTGYGEVFEVWFDGACGEGPNGKRQVYDWPGFVTVVRECQPRAVIFSDAGPDVRWVGNEQGAAGETNWSFLRRDEVYPGYERFHELPSGHADGDAWVPAECDVSIRPGWYYHAAEDSLVRDLKTLVGIYFASVGRNANLLLNIPVDRRGLIPDNDARQLHALRAYLDFAFREDLAAGRPATASNTRGGDLEYAAVRTVDGRPQTYWATDDSIHTGWVEIDLGAEREINALLLREQISLGQRIEAFGIDVRGNRGWTTVAEGTTVGARRILLFPPVRTSCIRVTIRQSRACPTLSTVSVYNIAAPDR